MLSTTSDVSPPGGFTALLIADDSEDDDDVLSCDILDQKPLFLLSPPPPETLESLIPPSLLSGYLADKKRRTPSSFPHSSSPTHSFLGEPELLNPRKQALEPIPEYSYFSESQQFQIPMLHSPRAVPPAQVMPTLKVPREGSKVPVSEPTPPPPTLESILNGFSLSEFVAALLAQTKEGDGVDQVRSYAAEKGKKKNEVETNRRRRISEKVRCLGKLLPSDDKKMTIATILEEAHSYIQFLQAQIQVLSSMPARSAYGGNVATAAELPYGVGGRLGRLSRQELLQVVVNSPAAQAVLSSDNACVVSAEQVELLSTTAGI